MSVIHFPPRDAGSVLAQALAAALQAGEAEAKRLRAALFEPWGARRLDPVPGELVRRAAMIAAVPILRALTADKAMVEIVAAGMADEVMGRLHKRGAA